MNPSDTPYGSPDRWNDDEGPSCADCGEPTDGAERCDECAAPVEGCACGCATAKGAK